MVKQRLSERPPQSPAEAVSRIYEAFADGRPTAVVGDKTPGYVEHLPLLSRTFHGAKFIHVVRHPLDVVASLARQAWGPNDPLASGWLWLRGIRSAAGASLPPETLLVVRLEDLVEAPTASVARMSAHLGVDAHADMLRFSDRAEQITKENIHPAGHSRLSQPLAATRDWSQELSERDAERVWALVRATAEPLGYAGPAGALPKVSETDAALRLAAFNVARSWRHLRTIGRMMRA